jgi:hypothetical protein
MVVAAAPVALGSTRATALELPGLGASVTMAYASHYLSHGYDVLDDAGAFQPEVVFEWGGWSIGLGGSFADDRTHSDCDELIPSIGYGLALFEDESYGLELGTAYSYTSYPHVPAGQGADAPADGQEVELSIALPNLLSLGELAIVPSYTAFFDWQGMRGDAVESGWFHVVRADLSRGLDVEVFSSTGFAVSAATELEYNDGVFGSSPGWSHVTLEIGASLEWESTSFAPALVSQWSFEDTVNHEDELFGIVTLSHTF